MTTTVTPSKKFGVVLTSRRRQESSSWRLVAYVAGLDFCRLPKTSSRRRRQTSNAASSRRRVCVGLWRQAWRLNAVV